TKLRGGPRRGAAGTGKVLVLPYVHRSFRTHMSLLPKAAAVALAAVALAPAAAHAQSQLPHTLGVAWQPSAPTTHDDLTFKATTTAPDVSWDWDGDGHTDATGAQQTHRF